MDMPTHCGQTGQPLFAHNEHRSYPHWSGEVCDSVQWRHDEWEQLQNRPAQARAVFLNDTPFEDHLCYGEWRPTRIPRSGWRHQLGWVHLPIEDKTLRRQVGRAIASLNLWTETEVLTDNLLNKRIIESLNKAHLKIPDTISAEIVQQLPQHVRAAIKESAFEHRWEHGDAQYNLFAKTTLAGEPSVMTWLRGAGAQREQHWADSGTTASRGERWRLSIGDTHIHYVPHTWVDDEWQTYVEHSIHVPRLSPAIIRLTRDALLEQYTTYATELSDLLSVTDHKGKQRLELKRKTDEKTWESMLEAAANGTPIKRRDHECTIAAVTEEMLQDMDGRMFDGKWLSGRMHGRLSEYETALDMLSGSSWQWQWTDRHDDHPLDGKSRVGFRSAIAMSTRDMPHANRLARILERYVPWAAMVYETQTSQRLTAVTHDAPRSERGLLRIENAAVEQAVTLLQEAGVVGEWLEHIPTSLQRYGRVLPQHPTYQQTMPALPGDRLLIHGLTGVHNGETAIKRLQSIIEAGGIKSIYERRRMRVDAGNTMSPTGDTGSGIDEGVPTVLGNPVFGQWIFFILKPAVLTRRDVWFAPNDFGGSASRYDSYNNYAQLIGQGKLHWPASDDARLKHYRHGLGSSNEAYLRYEVQWDDIAAVVVDKSIVNTVTEMLMNQPSDIIPSGIEIITGGRSKIPDAVKRVRRVYRDTFISLPHGIEKPQQPETDDEEKPVSTTSWPKGVQDVVGINMVPLTQLLHDAADEQSHTPTVTSVAA